MKPDAHMAARNAWTRHKAVGFKKKKWRGDAEISRRSWMIERISNTQVH